MLLDPRADLRCDFPLISPRGRRRAAVRTGAARAAARPARCPGSVRTSPIGQRVHLAMTRYLYAYREQASGPVLVEPTIDPGRWVSYDLRRGPLVVVLCDALRSTLLLDLERRLRDPIEVRRTPHRARSRDRRRAGLRALSARNPAQAAARAVPARSGHYFDYPGAVYQPLAPLRTWHWLDGFLNRHRALLDAAVRAATDEPDGGRTTGRHDSKPGCVATCARRCADPAPCRDCVARFAPACRTTMGSSSWPCRLRRDPNAPLRAARRGRSSLCHEPDIRQAARESPTLLHLCRATPPSRIATSGPSSRNGSRRSCTRWALRPQAGACCAAMARRAYAAQLKGTDSDNEDIVAAAVATLNLIASCQRRGLPPPRVDAAVGRDRGPEPHRGIPGADAAAACRVGPRARAADATRAPRLRRGRLRARGHLVAAQARPPTAIPRRHARGHGSRAHTRPGKQRERAMCATCDRRQWTAPVAAFEYEGVLVVPLESMVALWDEGLACATARAANSMRLPACAGPTRLQPARRRAPVAASPPRPACEAGQGLAAWPGLGLRQPRSDARRRARRVHASCCTRSTRRALPTASMNRPRTAMRSARPERGNRRRIARRSASLPGHSAPAGAAG